MKIYDCFLFFNELELLELRLMTLYDVVDHFVLVEAGTTFSGNQKELYFENNKLMFEKYLDKIIHVKIEKLPFTDAWENEHYNRELIMSGLTTADGNDYIIISDVDEIPNSKTLLYGIKKDYDVFSLNQKLFYYYVNCMQNQEWFGSVVIKKWCITSLKFVRGRRNDNVIKLNDGGWHYSFFGGKDKIKIKLASYAYANTHVNGIINGDEHIIKCLETGADLFDRTEDMFKKRFILLDEIGHKELKEWLIKYPNFIKI
jgi:beta-1,4-mannosyl-glycoprotein beta-1,4-N-acetylglucosaminyltransferase